MKKRTIILTFIVCLTTCIHLKVYSYGSIYKYPDYAKEFIGEDKLEKFNRKIFNFNLNLNKYAIRPIHILWASIMPQYGMDRIHNMSSNIEYPIRLISSLIQKDFTTSKNETIRFFTNTILGLGGMYDPAKKIFNIEPSNENMEQALAGCKLETGKYFVLPIISFTSFRGILGKILDMTLNPTSYVGSPFVAAIKTCFTINKTSYMQPFIKLLESTFADPYLIAKDIFAVDNYIKCNNLDRLDIISLLHLPVIENLVEDSKTDNIKEIKETSLKKDIVKIEVSSMIIPDLLYGRTKIDEQTKNYSAENYKLKPDIILKGYNPQNPVVDSMRTALFNVPGVNKSIWNELSIWNRSFARTIKEDNINLTKGRNNYTFRYLLQPKTKVSKLAIIFPSIGESILSSHSVFFSKFLYDAGFSIIILGSHFQWEFVNSMPNNYYPGIPREDAKMLILTTDKIKEYLSNKYNYKFDKQVIIGTSLGGLAALFVGDNLFKKQNDNNTQIIAICPPINLIYTLRQVDKNSEEWNNSPETLKNRIGENVAKIVNIYNHKDNVKEEINNLPFSEDDGKLITGFLMHQKLSDLIYSIEKNKNNNTTEIYKTINDTNFEDYLYKYILPKYSKNSDNLENEVSLASISYYLENDNNYKIYHSINDYLISYPQLYKLKQYCKDKLIIFNNGAHLGFLYRNEFIELFKETIKTGSEVLKHISIKTN